MFPRAPRECLRSTLRVSEAIPRVLDFRRGTEILFSQRRLKKGQCIIEENKKGIISSRASIIKRLGKMRLTLFVSASSVAGGIMTGAPVASIGLLGLGVTALSLSANTMNQCLEISQDALMCRTKRRPLVTGEVSLHNALAIGATEFMIGSLLLYQYSFSCCLLGALNWVIYVCLYTPSKKITIFNTEIGAIVGAIPPVMGGLYLDSWMGLSASVWLGVVIYLWQMPHFYALSFLCRKDYQRAGYRMLASVSVRGTCVKSFVYSLALSLTVVGGPCVLHFDYPLAYYYASGVLVQGFLLKNLLFHFYPRQYCRESFVFSYVWLGVQLLLMIIGHHFHKENKLNPKSGIRV